MKHLAALFVFGVSASASSQSIPNPGFESDCTFDLTGWDQFCSIPDAYPGEAHGGCYGLGLTTSDSFDPCFSNGEAIGVHTLMSGFQLGVPYQISIWCRTSDFAINSDVGIFSVPAGQAPYWNANGFTQAWPVGDGTEWMQYLLNFTIPEQFTGLDFYFFIEYSIAPDIIPGMKFFDDITITDLSTGMEAPTTASTRLRPNPATDRLWIDLPEVPLSITAIDASGRTHDLKNFTHRDRTLEVDVNALSGGITSLRITTNSGTQNLWFIKM
ncbi:MAG: hypothetical protein KA791_15140 [Flavobacteriales bacterium]|nr:hypothetical protein [Flavobacteriales bacterium]